MNKKIKSKNSDVLNDKVVALRYNQKQDNSPRVIARGKGYIASQIRAIAEEYNIPIKQDSDLVELLIQIDIDKEIPPELYAAVAEILSWVYRANSEIPRERHL
ncbi:MAG: EscU/YscU/HrcU family type III secretion system export apparatus switch protein [Chitinispirillia bacterium]|jgi:flagellar biosynthesis protein